MKKTITVRYELYDTSPAQVVNIPIAYEVEELGSKEVYKCSVALEEQQIPEWLTVRDFDIPTSFSRGVNVTHFSEVKGMRTIDAMLFVTKAYQDIRLAESLAQ